MSGFASIDLANARAAFGFQQEKGTKTPAFVERPEVRNEPPAGSS